MRLWLASVILTTLVAGPGGSCHIPSRQKAGKNATTGAASVVVINLHGSVTETGDDGSLWSDARSLRKLLRTFRKARQSKKVDKVVLRIGRLSTGWAQITELRKAVQLTRKAGKRVIAHLDDAGNREYFLATAADEIVMSASGSLWLVGVSAQAIFLRGLLDKVGIEAEFLHEGKYKGAADALTRKTMSPAMKEALGGILDNTYQTLVEAVAASRGMDPARVKTLIDQAPLAAPQLKNLKLIDRIADHEDETRRLAGTGSINWTFGKKPKEQGTLRSLMELFKPALLTRPPSSPHVALVYAEGQILYGPRRKGFGVSPHVASHDIIRVLDKVRESEQVKAVVLRINSPGGSALASDLIWNAVKRLAATKPVVVSMGDVAASGGYYIAVPATRVFAQPTTLTGSIGVIGGKFSLAGLMQKIGVSSETLTRGARADIFNLTRSWTQAERQVIQQYMHRTYKQFVDRVAQGRKLTPAAVEKVAQGRIWSGRAAREHKLVDQLGGLLDAVTEAKKLGKLASDAKTAVYPRPMTWIEKLQDTLGGADARAQLTGALLSELQGLPAQRELRGVIQALRAWQQERVLMWLPIIVTVQ
ncbi:MAG: signal peptide peptidase SppA [bacterium]